jgi:hypothetical protein
MRLTHLFDVALSLEWIRIHIEARTNCFCACLTEPMRLLSAFRLVYNPKVEHNLQSTKDVD